MLTLLQRDIEIFLLSLAKVQQVKSFLQFSEILRIFNRL